MRKFAAIRVGKESLDQLKKLDALTGPPATPVVVALECAQIPLNFDVGTYVFVWFSAGTSKGAKDAWHQGLRALGKVTKLNRHKNFKKGLSKFEFSVPIVLERSLDQNDLLDADPATFRKIMRMPVVGLRDWSGQTVRMIDEIAADCDVRSLFELICKGRAMVHTAISSAYPDLASYLPLAPPATTLIPPGKCRIYYGAPGAGKSHRAECAIAVEPEAFFRTVFHGDYTRADFIGRYQPIAVEGKSFPVTYEFIPGPFTEAVVYAVKNPLKSAVLLIEEINRANAAAVFGEVFQLLDRRENGLSRYAVRSDPVLHAYLRRELGGVFDSGLLLPANLSLLATMNSADQGVRHLDAAFKRRWEFEYTPLDFTACPLAAEPISYGGVNIPWGRFAPTLNRRLTSLDLPEDRLIGPYFISKQEFANNSLVASKLLLYLWDDLLRFSGREKIFHSPYIKTEFSAITAGFVSGAQVFEGSMHSELLAGAHPPIASATS